MQKIIKVKYSSIMLMRFFTAISFLFCSNILFSQEEDGLVKWLTFEEAQEKNKTAPKPLIIDFYTDWCGWCKHMMKTTYSNPNIANYINANFYPVKFDAEGKDTVEYNGKIYKPTSAAPRTPHELAIKFIGERLSYPSTIFVTNNYEFNLLVPGFIEDKKIEPILIFMVENAWQTTTYQDFDKHFNHTFYDTVYPKFPVKVNDIKDLEKLQKKQAKKVLVTIGADFCNTGKVMNATTFVDTSIAKYVSKHYYLVNFNVASVDTLLFKNEKYYNTVINNYPMHNLALKLTNNRFSLPALCILDEDLNLIDVLNFYQGPERLKPILSFIGSNSYKSKTFNDYMQEYMNPKPKEKKR